MVEKFILYAGFFSTGEEQLVKIPGVFFCLFFAWNVAMDQCQKRVRESEQRDKLRIIHEECRMKTFQDK